ncbi:putative 2,4-dichlorophenoxyacetate alpha-ketoglutarate dioxygenase [Meredithblackwellia eburnea MCA 4105]
MPIEFIQLGKTFVAECRGVDFSVVPLPEEDLKVIKEGIAKYGVLIFKRTGLDDERHIAFGKQFSELDDVKPYNTAGRKNRLKYDELFDVSNLDETGNIAPPDAARAVFNRANSLFHCDSSFNARRCGFSLLLAHQLPPPGTGGETCFADTRSAYEDLPQETKDKIANYTANHTMLHSRRKAAPGHPLVMKPEYDPATHQQSKHTLVQKHQGSGRTNLYIAAHTYSIDQLPLEEGQKLIDELLEHCSQDKYVYESSWDEVGMLTMWDNTCVMHRAKSGDFVNKYPRDMRRVTCHDDSPDAYGLNGYGSTWRCGLP